MLGAATQADIAVAPMPASTAPRTASLDGGRLGNFGRVAYPEPEVDPEMGTVEGDEVTR